MNMISDWFEEKPLVLWGAGIRGAKIYAQLALLEIQPLCLVDSNAALNEWTDIQGKTNIVYRPNWLISQRGKIHIFVAVRHCDEIVQQLINMGFAHGVDFVSSNDPGVMEKLGEMACTRYIRQEFVANPPIFTRVEIETINRCNNDCSFCPANRHVDTRAPLVMTQEMLCNILDQLGKLKYKGRLSLFSNNEPLLDKRIGRYVKMAREKVPGAIQFLATNGILLSPVILEEIMPYLDELIIDNYSDDMKLIPPVQETVAHLKNFPAWAEKVKIVYRLKTEVLFTRAGQAPNRREYTAPFCGCNLPFMQIIIRPDGKVSLCCNDAMGVYTLGDITKQSLLEIWYGDKYQKLRDTMISKGRPALDLCRHCDAHYVAYFAEWSETRTRGKQK